MNPTPMADTPRLPIAGLPAALPAKRRHPLWLSGILAACAVVSSPSFAEDLGTYSISPNSPEASIVSGPYTQSNQSGSTHTGLGEFAEEMSGLPTSELDGPGQACNDQFRCDELLLQVDLPSQWLNTHPNAKLKIVAAWDDPLVGPTGASASDFDIYLLDANGNDLGGSAAATTANPEIMPIPLNAGSSTYRIRVVPYLTAGQTLSMNIKLEAGTQVTGTTQVSEGGPLMANYRSPLGLRAAEPTIGINRNTDDVFFMFNFDQARVSFDDSTVPATASWVEVTEFLANLNSGDPFLADDPTPYYDENGNITGYNPSIWTAQLNVATSIIGTTTDNGESWTVTQGGGQPHGADNQSIFGGPYPEGHRPLTATAEHALYYCSHAAVNATCSRSDDGGLTFNPSRPIFPLFLAETNDLCNNHGHVRVGADGTVYVPMNNTCNDAQGLAVSIDAGESWHFVTVPETLRGRWDPSVAIARDGKTLYFAYGEETGSGGRDAQGQRIDDDEPRVIKGELDKSNANAPTIHWDPRGAVNLAGPFGLKNIVFSTAIAGDAERAAVAFHGTTTDGDSGDPTIMASAIWHLYLAVTYDGGASWQVQNVTPDDPTQKGAVCDHGTSCATETRPADRNLLDFMGMTIDSQGRIVIGYADGCTGACVTGVANYDDAGVIARLVSGKGLLAEYDSILNPGGNGPSKSILNASRDAFGVALDWSAARPGDNGAPVAQYIIERNLDGGSFSELTRTAQLKLVDRTAIDASVSYGYRIQAMDSQGYVGPYSAELFPTLPTEDVCVAPGLTLLSDPAGDQTGPSGQDLQLLTISQFHAGDGMPRLRFQFRTGDLTVLPPNTGWYSSFELPLQDGETTATIRGVRMFTDAAGQVAYQAYTANPSNGGQIDGRFVDPDTTVAAESGEYGDGVISIVVKASDLFVVPGAVLTGFNAGTTQSSSNSATVPNFVTAVSDEMPDGLGRTGSFVVRADAHCAPNTAPNAVLKTDISEGPAPLTVNFDASDSSDPDAGTDTVDNFVFDFADGSSLASPDAHVSHQFSTPGLYTVHLRVQDSRGKTSTPTSVQVVVTDERPRSAGPILLGLADLGNGNGDDHALVVGLEAKVSDSQSGALLQQVLFNGDYSAELAVTIADAGDGDDIAVLGRDRAAGLARVQIRDARSGRFVSAMAIDAAADYQALHYLADSDGAGTPALALISLDTDGAPRVQLRGLDGANLGTVRFGSNGRYIDSSVIADGATSRIAILAELPSGTVRVTVKDLHNQFINTLFYPRNYTPLHLLAIPHAYGSGMHGYAVIGSDGSNARLTLQDINRGQRRNIGYGSVSDGAPQDLILIPGPAPLIASLIGREVKWKSVDGQTSGNISLGNNAIAWQQVVGASNIDGQQVQGATLLGRTGSGNLIAWSKTIDNRFVKSVVH